MLRAVDDRGDGPGGDAQVLRREVHHGGTETRRREEDMAEERVPAGLDPTVTRREVVFELEARNVTPMLKLATVSRNGEDYYTIACDEGQHLGGLGSAPPPLAYFSAAVAF
jgi:hypothetical protein